MIIKKIFFFTILFIMFVFYIKKIFFIEKKTLPPIFSNKLEKELELEFQIEKILKKKNFIK
ncbi:hypothetical protein MDPP_0041 [Candidatus Phytoplasma pini]|uniref:Uncharacterized protein n=1 Tax=Candidatus Phytoplasma pini TaxID=267362 RepID=A0A559KJW1_9MOLU|nr:hypothetical protein MDPP_0041 [Candidatus Phytoplasma pini]